MKKTIQLLKFLHKAEGTRFGKANEGPSTEFMPQLLVIVIGSLLMGYAGIKYSNLQALFGEPSVMFLGLILAAAVTGGLFFTLPQLINYMYFADDFDVFLSMPFSMPQILAAKVLSSADWLLICVFIVTIPFGITSGISCNMGTGYYLSAVLAFIFVPVFVLSLMAVLVMLIMFLIKGMRKNDTFKVMGAIVGFALILVYVFVIRGDDLTGSLAMVAGAVQKVNYLLPINIFLAMIMKGNVAIGLLGTLGLTLVAFLLFLLLARTIYLPALLSMGESSGKRNVLTSDMMMKECRQSSVLKAYLKKEYRMVRRDPAFLLKGFLMTLFFPMVVVVLLLFTGSAAEIYGLSSVHDTASAAGWCTMVTTMITFVASCTNAIAASSISREGEEIQFLKQTPVPLETVLRAKHLLALLVCAAGSSSYVIIGGLILVVMGIIPIWLIPWSLLLNLAWLLFVVSITVLGDVKKPFLNWSDQAVMIKKTSSRIRSVLLLLGGMLIPMVVWFVITLFEELWYVPAGAFLLLAIILGLVMTLILYKSGVKKMAKYK